MSSLAKLEELKMDIRSLLVSRNSENITLPLLNKLYKDITDQDIPYIDFHYTSLKLFLASMPEILHLEYNKKNELCAYHVESDKSKHISILVSKEKKDTDKEKNNRRRKRNLIDPRMLNEILSELCDSSTAQHGVNKKVKKADVLSSIKSKIGEYAFYDVQDLNNQLNELTHILYYTDEFIYFKHGAPLVKKRTNNKMTDAHSRNDMDKKTEGFAQNSSVGDLIRSSTRERLQKLIEKHPNGIWCNQLPKLYQREFKLDLEYTDLGFSCIIDFVCALSDILRIVTAPNSKHYVLDARTPVDNYEYQSSNLIYENKVLEESDNVAALPANLSTSAIKSLKPDDVMYDETIDHINIPSVKYLDVIISEVHHPSFFWAHFMNNKKVVNSLMQYLQEFYRSHDLCRYKMPSILVKPKVHVACLFGNMWHRGVIKKMTPEGPMVHFYDYGTNEIYSSEDLYFLSKKFSAIPKQAIRCNLLNVKPVGDNKWSSDISYKFTQRVFNKPFVAHISSIDHEENSMVVDLVDTNHHSIDIYISRWMVKNKLAEWITPVTKTMSALNNCNQYMQKLSLGSSLDDTNSKEDTDIKHNISMESDTTSENSSTTSFLSIKSSKKLEILRKYKMKFLNNSAGLSSPCYSSDGDSSNEKESSFKGPTRFNY
ncbi:hypothetical protein TSAR_007320 [Trichomalopsis sarcophagae]|uniref:HTH OST-type domain-containing protein n=1 Tax=Trichomalopsis sarcophagae TaxID=543379 RepID=A0A232FJM7_9HYME|nr:hypothetical protein TSAR_007320 [Trichomalopsis sarcophagae]